MQGDLNANFLNTEVYFHEIRRLAYLAAESDTAGVESPATTAGYSIHQAQGQLSTRLSSLAGLACLAPCLCEIHCDLLTVEVEGSQRRSKNLLKELLSAGSRGGGRAGCDDLGNVGEKKRERHAVLHSFNARTPALVYLLPRVKVLVGFLDVPLTRGVVQEREMRVYLERERDDGGGREGDGSYFGVGLVYMSLCLAEQVWIQTTCTKLPVARNVASAFRMQLKAISYDVNSVSS